jgi:RHS repeat-associated protein
LHVAQVGGGTTTFAYDADGGRVKTVKASGATVYTPFPDYEEELNGPAVIRRSTYRLAGQLVAVRVSGDPVTANNGLFYYHTDHLGSTAALTKGSDGAVLGSSVARYYPFGAYRTAPTPTVTDREYTGHRHNDDIGLIYMNARYFVPYINRWIQPDTIVPDPTNPQSFNRYSFVLNNPIRFKDPTGHFCYDAAANEFSEGSCFDAQQQELLDYFLSLLGQRSNAYTDLDITRDLLLRATDSIDDPVAALRAASEIVRAGVIDPGFGFGFEESKFFYGPSTTLRLGDAGFGDLADLIAPNQVAHLIGEAYVGAFMHRKTGSAEAGEALVWGNEVRNLLGQPLQETIIDTDLGIIANDLGACLETGQEADLAASLAVEAIQDYDWPWSPALSELSRMPFGFPRWPFSLGVITSGVMLGD